MVPPFATQILASYQDCLFHWRFCFSDSFSLSAWVKKTCLSSATSKEIFVTSLGVVCMSSRILRRDFSVNLNSSLEETSAAVLTEPSKWVFFEYLIYRLVTRVPQRWSIASFGRIVWLNCYVSGQSLVLLFHTKKCKVDKCKVYCQKVSSPKSWRFRDAQ